MFRNKLSVAFLHTALSRLLSTFGLPLPLDLILDILSDLPIKFFEPVLDFLSFLELFALLFLSSDSSLLLLQLQNLLFLGLVP